MMLTTRKILRLGNLVMVALVVAVNAQAQQIKNAIPELARPLPLSAGRLTGRQPKDAGDVDSDYLGKLETEHTMGYHSHGTADKGKGRATSGIAFLICCAWALT